MATRSPRRARSRTISGAPHRRSKRSAAKANAAEPASFEEVAARAARLGITAEKVLQEYAHIAFADLTHILEWDDHGVIHLKQRDGLTEADRASISEISGGGAGKGPVRVKLYDKKAALDAIARHLGMFPPPPRRHEDGQPEPESSLEDAREEFERRVARLVARRGAKEGDPVPEHEDAGDPQS